MARVLKVNYGVGSLPYFMWRSIMWGRGVLKKGVRWRIGNRENVSIYEDQWLLRESTFRVYSPRFLPEGVLVAGLIGANGSWSEEIVRRYFILEEAEAILGIPLSRNQMDSVMWHYDKRGEFSVKSAYKIAQLHQNGEFPSSSKGPNFL
ncbi:hypothetical protein ACOSQ3_024054 [Xanthoceras sorbifolium]